MNAVIETGGKQYKVSEGDVIFIEKLDCKENDEVIFDKVVAVIDEDKSNFGQPYLKNVQVKGTVLKNGKGKKITVFTYKPKKDSKRKLGHRQLYSKVRIESVKV